ncbi:MAG: LacI family DNA-binding transcriptional regulator [Microbacteriaceae bacterium]
MARLKDVALLAEVSLSVASRVLNNDSGARINPATRQRVVDAAESLSYVPDHRARALRLSRAGAIALVVPEVNNAIFASLHAGVQEACQERSTAVFLAQLGSPTNGGAALANLIGNGRVDGVILQRSEEYSDEALRSAIALEVPLVLFNSTLDGHTGSVALDDHASVSVALDHLASLGHKRVGFLSGAARHDAAIRREKAFRELTAQRGLITKDSWIQQAGWEAPAGAHAMATLLAQADRPTAVLVASLNSGIGALHSAYDHGVSVPEAMSVMAIHDTWLATYSTPTLTTVAMPMHAAGRAAATMLLDHVAGGELHDVIIDSPAPQLMARKSTSAPAP